MTAERRVDFFFSLRVEKKYEYLLVWACYSMAVGTPCFLKPGKLSSTCTDGRVADLPDPSFFLLLSKEAEADNISSHAVSAACSNSILHQCPGPDSQMRNKSPPLKFEEFKAAACCSLYEPVKAPFLYMLDIRKLALRSFWGKTYRVLIFSVHSHLPRILSYVEQSLDERRTIRKHP